jgi:hypothetical protein
MATLMAVLNAESSMVVVGMGNEFIDRIHFSTA